MKPNLRFNIKDICSIACRYEYAESDTELNELKPVVNRRGCLEKADLKKIASWKAPRSAGNVLKNNDEYVREITRFALNAGNERARIESLTILDGVGWPTASVILHFFHKAPYPILDYRALWSVSMDVPTQYKFGFWWTYVKYCRQIASDADVDMRLLDTALWQYSKDNQP